MFAVVGTAIGARPYQEDAYAVCPATRLVAVFDGHGGGAVSKYCAANVVSHVRGALGSAGEGEPMPSVLMRAFVDMDEGAARAGAGGPFGHTGCTACVAVCGADDVWVANAGDSRAVLCIDGVVAQLTRDHKPELPDERARVVGNGGTVAQDGYGSWRINSTLNVSRGIGDWHLRPLVVCTPEVTHVRRPRRPFTRAFMVIGSDGLWDVYSSEGLCRDLCARLDDGATPQQAVQRAVNDAVDARPATSDNVTAAFVHLWRGDAPPTTRIGERAG